MTQQIHSSSPFSALFSDQQKRRALIILSLFHILIITASNYLVQIPFSVQVPFTEWQFHSTWGSLTFPFIFIATDLTVRVFGAREARWIIFAAMLPALLVSYVVSILFSDGQYQGINALASFSLPVFRIALASFCAYICGQLLDVLVFNRLRQWKIWWIAPSSSMIFGSMADTFMFFSIAFYASSDSFMAENWVAIGVVDYLSKLLIGIVLFVPAYGVVLNMILQKLRLLSSQQQTA
ncbi:MAG: 7-cyano-7-deazaguanine/7-aminomethyl-7-deazaguanine transporter [Pasteurellaceae bacterium]|nr:7-cyano-7-deazaguanine/7-aminomethyl-7-deazaguanine transporter [Pasteurellaceae bacterium]